MILLAAVLSALGGCAGPGESGRPDAGRGGEGLPSPARDKALQHFIDGTVYEMQGDFAKAVIEYQEALRAEQGAAVYFALARCYAGLGKHGLAVESGREAVRLDPDRLEYRRGLAEACVEAMDLEAAEAEYAAILGRDSGDADAWRGLARIYQGRNPLKALAAYTRIADRFGPDWDVLMRMAEIQNSLGLFAEAAGALGRMLELDPGNQPLRYELAQAHARAGNFDTSLALLGDLTRTDPDNPRYAADRAEVLIRQKRYGEAAGEFRAIRGADSSALDARIRVAELFYAQAEEDSTLAPAAESLWTAVAAGHPQDWRPHWFLGAVGSLTGNDSLAIAGFGRVTRLAPWNPDGWVSLASLFLNREDHAGGARVLEEAARNTPEDFRVQFLLGVAYSRMGLSAEALLPLERARALDPQDVNPLIQLALVYDAMGRADKTDPLYEEALRIEPDNHLVLNNYGYSLAERNIDLDRAYAMARKALDAQPENQSYLDTMGWVCYRRGKYREAEQYILQAIARGEAGAVLYEHLGDVYFMMDRPGDALEQWRAALRLDAENAGLREKIRRGSL
ncbi:MAG: tetratricopeptide repeat protein [Bacteroidota bacterium]